MGLSPEEQRICARVAEREQDLVELASTLIGFDTTARNPGDPPREEAGLQRHLADRLANHSGAEIDLFEPDPEAMAGRPLVPPGLDFAGRPQLIATLRGNGGGRSLVFNGHIDVVSAEPRAQWANDPFVAELRDGRLYGRGACDMKGGIAAMVLAAEVLAELGVPLRGDLLVATNTDEESSGAGGSALVQHGIAADAGIVTEPTGFDTWIACRGSEYGVISVPGRPGHAEVRQPHWQRGGAVNAIDKAAVVLASIEALRQEWAGRREYHHPHVSPPSLLATMARAGEWPVTYPASCELTIATMFVAAQADAHGWGADVRREVEQWIVRDCARDDWLAEHPPRFDWWPNAVMPMDIPESDPIVATMTAATADTGNPGRISGLDSWYDGATLTQLAGIPSIGYGPPGFDADGVSVAHMIDEYVPVAGLVACAKGLAVAAMRFCA
jgi:acetylornithine deacetylase